MKCSDKILLERFRTFKILIGVNDDIFDPIKDSKVVSSGRGVVRKSGRTSIRISKSRSTSRPILQRTSTMLPEKSPQVHDELWIV